MSVRARHAGPALALLALLACRPDPSRSPTCGLALVAGPALIQQEFHNARSVLTDAPRGLPGRLAARIVAADTGHVVVGYGDGRLLLGYQGRGFPTQPGFALLVVDDTSQRAMGVLVYDKEGPRDFPALGSVTGGELTLPLYGVRVDWASVSNPRCPLLGGPVS